VLRAVVSKRFQASLSSAPLLFRKMHHCQYRKHTFSGRGWLGRQVFLAFILALLFHIVCAPQQKVIALVLLPLPVVCCFPPKDGFLLSYASSVGMGYVYG
jgi:hypothetical protein